MWIRWFEPQHRDRAMHPVWIALVFPWWAQRISSPIYRLFDTEIKRAKTHLYNGKWVNVSLPTEHSAYHASHSNVTHSRKYADFMQRNVKTENSWADSYLELDSDGCLRNRIVHVSNYDRQQKINSNLINFYRTDYAGRYSIKSYSALQRIGRHLDENQYNVIVSIERYARTAYTTCVCVSIRV